MPALLRHARELLLSIGLVVQISAFPLLAQSEKPKAEQELTRIGRLSPGAQRTALQAFLRSKDLDIDDTNEFFVQIAELRRPIARLVNGRDVKENIALGALAAIGEPDAVRRVLKEIPPSGEEVANTDLAESILSNLGFPLGNQEWDLLARGARNEFGGGARHYAILSLKLNASPRAQAVLKSALLVSPDDQMEIEDALSYIRSGAAPMEGQELAALARRTAEAVSRGELLGVRQPHITHDGALALVRFDYLAGCRYENLAVFRRVARGWRIQSVLTTGIAKLPPPPPPPTR